MISKFALSLVFTITLLDSIGFGIILPVMPELLMEVSGESLAASATYGGWLLFAYAAMQFFFAPILGNLSDAYGRRPVLLVSLLVLAGNYFVMGLAESLTLLFIGRIASGIGAGTMSALNAYIADTVPAEQRAQYFGLLGAAFGAGFIIGPVLGGVLAEFGSRVPFFATGGLVLCSLLLSLFLLPESLAPEHRRRFQLTRANPFAALAQMSRFRVVFGVLGVMFLYNVGHHVLPAVWSFYGIERFDWTPRQVGYSLGFVGVCMVLVQGFVIRLVVPAIGLRWAGVTGLACTIVGFVGISFAFEPHVAYLALLPMALGGLASPAMHGIASAQLGPDQQGELQGTAGSIMSLASIMSPPIMTNTFSLFTTGASAPITTGGFGLFSAGAGLPYFPGAPFLLASLLTLLALALFVRTTAGVETKASTQAP